MTFDHALFLDRDGTIIEDCEGALSLDKIKFEEHLFDFISYAIKRKFKIVMVTNQTSVSKGLITFSEMKKINNILLRKINDLVGQKVFDSVFICPYHPDAFITKYKLDSEDRKPKPGMLIEMSYKKNIDLSSSLFIGDSSRDEECAIQANCSFNYVNEL